jgi:hypothetical protein
MNKGDVTALTHEERMRLSFAGAPMRKLGFRTFKLRPRLGDIDIHGKPSITASKQADKLAPHLEGKEPLSGITILAGRESDDLPLKLALRLAANQQGEIRWRRVRGGFDNPVLEEVMEFEPGLFVLWGLYQNSTGPVFEKARDILAELNCPVILVVVGADPVHFAHNNLFIPVKRLAYFTRGTPLLTRRPEQI